MEELGDNARLMAVGVGQLMGSNFEPLGDGKSNGSDG